MISIRHIHEERDLLPLAELLQSANDEYHTDGQTSRPEAALLVEENSLGSYRILYYTSSCSTVVEDFFYPCSILSSLQVSAIDGVNVEDELQQVSRQLIRADHQSVRNRFHPVRLVQERHASQTTQMCVVSRVCQ